jgi:trimeric autotransporter adhesin
MDMQKTIVLALCSLSLWGLPKEMHVISGKASLSQKEQQLTIECSDKTFLEWNQFSIGKNEMVRFMQQGADSLAVNRVTGNEASHIMGQLIANGNVYLINPQGILIGPDATIVANTFLATTIDAASEEILKNKEILFQGSTGFIDQQGLIETKEGVFLISPKIEESGTLRGEHVALAGSTKVLFSPHKRQKIYLSFEVDEGEIDHKGSIEALCTEMKASGAHAKAISSTGSITTVKKEAGAIYIVAEKGRTTFDGAIKAPSASVHLLAEDRVTLGDNALIDVSSTSPGEILIGGDYKGQNPEILNASFNHVKPGAKLLANNLHKGDGGKIVVWADSKTLYQGHLESKGGPNGGNGGFAEVSGKIDLGFLGTVDMTAAEGKSGQLLLDPQDIIITDVGADPAVDYFFDNTGGTINIFFGNLQAALNASSITLQANRDFTYTATTGITTSSSNDLNIAAGRSIRFDNFSRISLDGGNITLRINDERADPAFRTAGQARLRFDDEGIETNGGSVTGTVGSFGGTTDGIGSFAFNGGEGIFADGGDIFFEFTTFGTQPSYLFSPPAIQSFTTTGDGNITFRGTFTNNAPALFAAGCAETRLFLETVDGDIEVTSTANFGGGTGIGYFLSGVGSGSFNATTQTGKIEINSTLNGAANSSDGIVTTSEGSFFNVNSGSVEINVAVNGGTGDDNIGFNHISSSCSFTGSGPVVFNLSTTGINDCHAFLEGSSLNFTWEDNDITINATSAGTGNSNFGVFFDGGGGDFVGQGGSLTINGTGGAGVDDCRGINFIAASTISTTSGDIIINSTARGTGNNNQGILYNAGNVVTSTSGSITLQGTASDNESDDVLITNGTSMNTAGPSSITIIATDKDCTVSNGSVASQGSGNVNFNVARDLFITSPAAGQDGQVEITNAASGGSINLTAGRDVQIESSGATAEVTHAGLGQIAIVSGRDINLTGGSTGEDAFIRITNGASPGQLLLLADEDVRLRSLDGGLAHIRHAGPGTVFVVVDNAFPNFPTAGEGMFINDFSGTDILANGELRIYTVSPTQNLIYDRSINSETFNLILSTDVGNNTDQAIYSRYYPTGNYPAGAFTFYYKTPFEPRITDGEIAIAKDNLSADQSEFLYMTTPFIIYNTNLNYVFKACDSIKGVTICPESPYDLFYIDSVWNLIRKAELD